MLRVLFSLARKLALPDGSPTKFLDLAFGGQICMCVCALMEPSMGSSYWTGKEMLQLFSPQNRFSTWRKLWLWLAEGERELGLDISSEALKQMSDHIALTQEDFDVAREEESRRRHDVMAHVHGALSSVLMQFSLLNSYSLRTGLPCCRWDNSLWVGYASKCEPYPNSRRPFL